MRRISFGLMAATLLAGCEASTNDSAAGDTNSAKAMSCGPDFILGDPRFPPKLAQKKQSILADGYPADAVSRMDKNGACVAAIDRAPDVISLRIVSLSNQMTTMVWSEDDERIAHDDLLAGRIKTYYRFNTSRRFSCCDEAAYDAQPDWNAAHDINRSIVIQCIKVGAGVRCG